MLATLALPIAVACAFAAAVGYVNYARWGNPLVFADLSRQIIALTQHPDRIARLHEYGEFNPIRLLYAFGYYFVPVWTWPDGAGGLLWSAFRDRVFDAVELPPGSLFVSEPLLIGLAAFALHPGDARGILIEAGAGVAQCSPTSPSRRSSS